MHDDDWFSSADSLKVFAEHMNEKVDCIFSGYSIYTEKTKTLENQTISMARFEAIQTHPYLLFAKNELGPPSVLLFRSSVNELYDPTFKWLVDLEAYIRMMLRFKAVYIPQPLITKKNTIGIITILLGEIVIVVLCNQRQLSYINSR